MVRKDASSCATRRAPSAWSITLVTRAGTASEAPGTVRKLPEGVLGSGCFVEAPRIGYAYNQEVLGDDYEDRPEMREHDCNFIAAARNDAPLAAMYPADRGAGTDLHGEHQHPTGWSVHPSGL